MTKKDPTHPVPPIDPPFDLPTLNQTYDESLHLIFRYPKCCTHTGEFDRGERLEVENECAISDSRRYIVEV